MGKIILLVCVLLTFLLFGVTMVSCKTTPDQARSEPRLSPDVTYTIDTVASPSGGGSIKLSPGGGTYEAGTEVTVTAESSEEYVFDHWTGDVTGTSNSVTVTMDANKSITANFIVKQRPLPSSIAAAKQMHTIQIEAGASSADIIAVYGQPSDDYWPENFNPPVRHIMKYRDQGLQFGLTRDKLSDIDATPNFQGEVFGLRIGDPISRAIAIYGNDYSTFESGTVEVGIAMAYYWEVHLPNWFVYVKDDLIVAFLLHDKSFYGPWMPLFD